MKSFWVKITLLKEGASFSGCKGKGAGVICQLGKKNSKNKEGSNGEIGYAKSENPFPCPIYLIFSIR
jgi:hypothetical protein